MSNIPAARDLLDVALIALKGDAPEKQIGVGVAIDAIEQAQRLMKRVPPARRRAPIQHPPLTAEQAESIRRRLTEHPDVDYAKVAHEFGTTIGRVSDAMHFRI